MSCDYIDLATRGVQGLQPYQPGKPTEELERELGISDIVKLASNENPLGPSPRVQEAIQARLSELTRYPDGNGYRLKQALAERLQVAPAQLTLGNGSNDVLELIARAYLTTDSEVIYSQHAFAVYPIVTQAIGARHVVTPACDWGHDLAAMADAITERTRLIFIANPNNPTGTWTKEAELRDFLSQVPAKVLVVLDEAYCEYVDEAEYPDGLRLLAEFPNLIVTRTFSKAYGLAGLRVGYSVANEAIADVLNRVRQPFNVNQLAQVAAEAALADTAYLARSVELNREGLAWMADKLGNLGLEYIPSVGNFLAIDVGEDAMPVYQRLLQHGVIVRPIAGYGMPRHLRVSIGTPQENERFLDALTQVLT